MRIRYQRPSGIVVIYDPFVSLEPGKNFHHGLGNALNTLQPEFVGPTLEYYRSLGGVHLEYKLIISMCALL